MYPFITKDERITLFKLSTQSVDHTWVSPKNLRQFPTWWLTPRIVSGLVHPSYFSGHCPHKTPYCVTRELGKPTIKPSRHTGSGPTKGCERWFINPIDKFVISTINHRIRHNHISTERYVKGLPSCTSNPVINPSVIPLIASFGSQGFPFLPETFPKHVQIEQRKNIA